MVDLCQQQQFIRQLTLFRDRLIDIDTRNPSLSLKKEVKAQSFDLSKLGSKTVGRVYTALGRGRGPRLVSSNSAEPADRAHMKHLRVLARSAEARTEETGLRDLFLGLCWLTGHLDAKKYVRGPLFLVPAQLVLRRGGRWPGLFLELSPGEILVNEALRAAIRIYRKVQLAPELVNDAQQTGDADRPSAGA